MEEELIEDSMNKDSEDSFLQSKIHQLENEVLRLKNIIKEERSKNKELEKSMHYFQKLYRKERIDRNEAQSAFNKMIGSLWVSDYSLVSGGRKSEEWKMVRFFISIEHLFRSMTQAIWYLFSQKSPKSATWSLQNHSKFRKTDIALQSLTSTKKVNTKVASTVQNTPSKGLQINLNIVKIQKMSFEKAKEPSRWLKAHP
jgi:septal ring factor EnvC (AmiA/AmiB activator)